LLPVVFDDLRKRVPSVYQFGRPGEMLRTLVSQIPSIPRLTLATIKSSSVACASSE
jgi:hypothetical protein